jgi:hypothetical protein
MTDPVQDFFDAPPLDALAALRAREYRRMVEEADSGSLSEDEERDAADRVR